MSVDQTHLMELNLGATLHDGSIDDFTFEGLSRSLTITVDAAYIRAFNNWPDDSRFYVTFTGIREMQALDFVPWAGAREIDRTLSFKEQESLRKDQQARSHLESISWIELSNRIRASEDYEILSATSVTRGDHVHVKLDLMNNVTFDYPELRLLADNISFRLGLDKELSINEFFSYGKTYWDAWGRNSSAQTKS